jgi:hypothetical protein
LEEEEEEDKEGISYGRLSPFKMSPRFSPNTISRRRLEPEVRLRESKQTTTTSIKTDSVQEGGNVSFFLPLFQLLGFGSNSLSFLTKKN